VAELTDRLRVSVGLEALHSEFTQYNGAQLFEPGIAGPCYASLPTQSGSNTLVTAPAAGVAGCYTSKGATGNQLPFAPTFTSDVTASYRLPTSAGDFNFSGTWDHDSGWFTGSENELKQKSYEMVSTQIAWDLPKTKLRVALFGRNLTDSLVYARGITTSPFGYLVTYQAPRTYGARVEYTF
jgi:iron complex outermembrane receptor protein